MKNIFTAAVIATSILCVANVVTPQKAHAQTAQEMCDLMVNGFASSGIMASPALLGPMTGCAPSQNAYEVNNVHRELNAQCKSWGYGGAQVYGRNFNCYGNGLGTSQTFSF
jgi:hypothetical protein